MPVTNVRPTPPRITNAALLQMMFKLIFKYKMADRPAAQKPRAKGHAGGKRSDHGGAEGERGQDFAPRGPECL